MAITLTIGGASKSYRVGSLSMSATANGMTSASFSVRSNDGTYRPALDAEVIITDGATRIFGGLVNKPSEAGVLADASGAHPAITTRVSAVDFHAYTERRYLNETIPAGTLKAALTVIVSYLSDYGVTLDAGQVDGPTLPELVYDYRQVTQALNELMTLTGKYGDPYVWRIDHYKVLSAAQPADVPAPFDITEGDGTTIGDVTVETSRDKYANKIILKVPTRQESNHVETFTGDGSTYIFQLTYTLTKPLGFVNVNGTDETFAVEGIGFDMAVFWLYSSVDNTIRRVEQGNPNPPANGAAISITFDGNYTGFATAEDAGEITANGLWEKVVTVDAVPSDTTAQALADGFLAKSLVTPKTIRYKTFETGLAPGQSQAIDMPSRNVDVTAVITDVVTRDYGTNRLQRDVTLTSGTTPQEGWRDVIKQWSGDKAGSGAGAAASATVGPAVPVSAGPGLPLTSVQFNDNNTFGGNASFTFDKTTTTVKIGLNHTVGGADNLLVGTGHTVGQG
jgi:hypothetical protein